MPASETEVMVQVNLTLTRSAVRALDSLRNGIERTRSSVVERLVLTEAREREQAAS